MDGRLLLAITIHLSVLTSYVCANIESDFTEEISNLKMKLEALERRLGDDNYHNGFFMDRHSRGTNRLGLRGTNRFGFTASLSHSLDAVVAKQLILFDNVMSNPGNTYNNNTGIYTCPLAGYYFLTCSITSKPGAIIQATITLDGKPVASIYANSGSSSSLSQASNSALIHCNVGQQVAVRVDNGNSIHGDMTSPVTSFTGFLLWDD